MCVKPGYSAVLEVLSWACQIKENDIENSAVTLRVNKSTAGFSLNRQLVFKRSPIKLEDFNRQIPRKTDN